MHDYHEVGGLLLHGVDLVVQLRLPHGDVVCSLSETESRVALTVGRQRVRVADLGQRVVDCEIR